MATRKTGLNLCASERFLKSYYKASIKLQDLAEGAVHDLIRRYRSNPKTFATMYDNLKQCKEHVIEVDISGGPRLLAHYSQNRITLLDMGDHDVVPRYNDNKFQVDINKVHESPRQFFPEQKSTFFSNYPDYTNSLRYMEEVSAEWLYFLDDEQELIQEEIFENINENYSSFIIGGPGTGKTCILLNLLKIFADSEYKIGILLSDNLTRYIEKTTSADIESYRVNLNKIEHLVVLLIDDPTYDELMRVLRLKKVGRIITIVAAFDPLQLDRAISDQEFNKIVYDYQIEVHELRQCYRQKENLGKNTKRIIDRIAESTPYLADNKIQAFQEKHKKLTKLSNDLDFVNPNGYVKTYPNATVDDVKCEIKRILKAKSLMWTHCEGLLILLDGLVLTEETNAAFSKLESINYVKTLSLDDALEVKGLQFQHVFIFIKKSLFDEVHNGFSGTGTRVYEQRRLLRIPFSRAKDSLVTFAVESDE